MVEVAEADVPGLPCYEELFHICRYNLYRVIPIEPQFNG